ncbi:MAG TPA: hypothetical protein VF855_13420 [Acidimicrobiales bacterium]
MVDEQPQRSGPVWAWILGLGLAALFAWWLVGAVLRTIVWGLKVVVLAVVVGAVIYALLAIMGKRPGSGGRPSPGASA